jgi:tetratricopeptide (TPR) repeat protein
MASESPKLFPIGLLVLVAAVFAVFLPALNSPLVFDDPITVAHARSFTSWKDIFGPDAFRLFRPVKNLQGWLMVKTGSNLAFWHSINIVAYALAACSVAGLTRKLLGSARWGLAAGVLWAFSATGVSTAVWVSCLNISIAVMGATLAVGLHHENALRERGLRWNLAAAFCWLIALLSYETAVAVAPLIVVLDWTHGRRIFSKQSLLRYAAFGLAGVIWFALRTSSGAILSGSAGEVSFPPETQAWQIAVSAPYFLLTHLMMWVAPAGKIEFMSSYVWNESVPSIVHPFCWIILAALVLAGFVLRKRSPAAAFGLFWFLIGSIPSGNFVPLRNTPFADYYVPFPSIGLALVLVVALRGLLALRADDMLGSGQRRLILIVAIGLMGARAAQLPAFWHWIQTWQTPLLVITESCLVRPKQYFAKSGIAEMMQSVGKLEIAEQFARESALEGPHMAMPVMILADIADKTGREEEAVVGYEKALDLKHASYRTLEYCNLRLGQILARKPGQLDKAMYYLRQVLLRHHSVHHEEAAIAAVQVLEINGKRDEALVTIRKGLTHHPDSQKLQELLKRFEADPVKP